MSSTMRVEPAALAVFLAIAKHHSFRRAASELGVTPSALSHALRALETQLGVRLLNRTTRSVALTEAGARLLARIGPAFRDIESAVDELNEFRDRPAGTLRLNMARAATRILLPMIARFGAVHPEIKVEVVSEDALVDVVGKGFDAGVRFGETIAADMVATPIGPRHAYAVVATPTLLAKHPIPQTPHDLRLLPCVRLRFASGVVYRWELERDGVEVEVDVDGPLTLSDIDTMVDAALSGIGFAYVFEQSARALIASGALVRVLADWCPRYPGFFLYYPSRQRQPAVLRAFLDFVRSEQDAAE
ncbi:MAG: LysR family transcriptional regulator [Polyangiales bacterium]